MFIKNKLDSFVHMKDILFREDLSKADKILLIRIILYPPSYGSLAETKDPK